MLNKNKIYILISLGLVLLFVFYIWVNAWPGIVTKRCLTHTEEQRKAGATGGRLIYAECLKRHGIKPDYNEIFMMDLFF